MGIFLERLILGGSFFLLLIIGAILLFLKDGLVQSPKMHRYLGASVLLTACSFLCMYMEMLMPDSSTLHVLRAVIALAAVVVCVFIGYKLTTLIMKNVAAPAPAEVTPQPQPAAPAKVEQPVAQQSEPVAEAPVAPVEETPEEPIEEIPEESAEDMAEEPAEEEDKDATDEDGNPVPEPSENNLEDLIFFQKLEALMAKKKLFTEQEISREQIAMQIGTNRTYLVRSIKLATGMTFNEYITNLRVNYAATLLATSDEPLEFIGDIAGFRSKSTYYRAFVAANNCTPSEYRNRNKQEIS